jgi:hypothetical protein
MLAPEQKKQLSDKLLEHLEAALAISDELRLPKSGYMIERALDQARSDIWPGGLDVP